MDPTQIQQAWEKGGWPAVFLAVSISFAKWYCQRKLAQDAKFHEEKMKELHTSQEMLGCVVDAVLALVYKSVNNEEAAKVMAQLTSKRLEAARAAERVAAQS